MSLENEISIHVWESFFKNCRGYKCFKCELIKQMVNGNEFFLFLLGVGRGLKAPNFVANSIVTFTKRQQQRI